MILSCFKARAVVLRSIRLAASLCLVTLAGAVSASRGQQNSSTNSGPKIATAQASAESKEESEALSGAVQSASGNPQALIKNLEDFLARFPQSPRREKVLRTILHLALQANDPAKAASYAEKLLELEPTDTELLSTLIDLQDRQNDPAGRERAAQYATRFIERAEAVTGKPAPNSVPAEKWPETQAMMRASGYLLRGQIYVKSGENEKAAADYMKSYAAYPAPRTAEWLGDLAASRGETDRAIDYYATAFAFPEPSAASGRKEQLRKKLGSAYLARYKSEKGLGDLVLAHYDELLRSLSSRFRVKADPNAALRDPFDYALLRLDGSELRLAEHRNKVVVMDFWATWCGPCRLEGKLLERVRETFHNQPAAIFLAVNVDDDREGVARFIQQEKWTVPVVYAQGLDHLLGVTALPTVVVFNRQGQVVFRQEGLDPGSFVETLEFKVREALGPL